MSGTAVSAAHIAPFAVWIALMTVLPPTAGMYAVRTAATVAALVYSAWVLKPRLSSAAAARALAWGVPAGLFVLAVWVLPERIPAVQDFYRRFFIYGEGGTAAVDSSGPALLAVRLCGSAFVISVAEELFFRRWLIGFAGFWCSLALFAVEHDRWLVAAVAGLVYSALALRKGLASAIAAHAVTNLALGVYVLVSGDWIFW